MSLCCTLHSAKLHSALSWTAQCTEIYCTVHWDTLQSALCIELNCTEHWAILHRALGYTVECTELYFTLHWAILHCTLVHCTLVHGMLHCTEVRCTVERSVNKATSVSVKGDDNSLPDPRSASLSSSFLLHIFPVTFSLVACSFNFLQANQQSNLQCEIHRV